jgi:hypothetical protein
MPGWGSTSAEMDVGYVVVSSSRPVRALKTVVFPAFENPVIISFITSFHNVTKINRGERLFAPTGAFYKNFYFISLKL